MRLWRKRSLFLLAFIILMAGWAWPVGAATEEALFQRAEQARKNLAKNKKDQGLRHKWLQVIEQYEAVLNKNPSGRLAERSLLARGDLYVGLYRRSRRQPDLDEALRHFRWLAKHFSRKPSAAQAQLRIGMVYYLYKKDMDRAYVEFLKVELNHPQANEVAEARKWMARISGPAEPEAVKPEPCQTARPSQVQGGTAMATGMRYWANPTYSRVVIDLDREIDFRDHLLRPDPGLDKPMRLYLDLSQARIGPGVGEEMLISDGLLKSARMGQHDQDTVRVVLDIQNIDNYRIFSLTNPFRIVVDVTGRQEKQAAIAAKDKTRPKVKSKPAPSASPLTDLRATAKKRKKVPRGLAGNQGAEASLARQLGLGIRKVVIDPGHGGKDPGAIGITKLREKDVTLRFSRKLAKKIRERLGLKVILTRDRDRFIPLEERTAIANTKGADLFISIHANAHRSSKVRGIETYFLNLATDDEAMRVAARENATTKKNMSDLQVILNDLMLNSKITESSRVAAKIHRAMVTRVKKHYKGVKDLGVKQAPFYVLIGANMPSVLLELGFITNKTDENRLRNKRYLNRMIDGIVDGIKVYSASMKKEG